MRKYLRIAVTALSLTACVLLVALWVRAYRTGDWVSGIVMGQHGLVISTRSDYISFLITDDLYDRRWTWRSYPIADMGRHEGIFGRFHIPDDDDVDPFIILPHWSLVLFAATSALLPWLSWRFSLRTLLIATTLVAVALVIMVVAH
jgi:hypothetical protein